MEHCAQLESWTFKSRRYLALHWWSFGQKSVSTCSQLTVHFFLYLRLFPQQNLKVKLRLLKFIFC